jgi:hypothetical protein
MLLIYLHLLPRMDRLEKIVIENNQQSQDNQEEMNETLKLLLKYMKEPERWNEAKQMMDLKK